MILGIKTSMISRGWIERNGIKISKTWH